jgi:hypothetical protein
MSFSERQGLKPARKILQTDSIDDALRNRLWNVLSRLLPSFMEGVSFRRQPKPYLHDFCGALWHSFFKIPIDSIPVMPDDALAQIRSYYFGCPWNEVYDFVEFFLPRVSVSYTLDSNTQAVNEVLASELSAYRLVAGRVVPISSEQEAQAVEKAIEQTRGPYSNSAGHLQQAVNLLARKPVPDFRNSIKESISAVEAISAVITGDKKAMLGDALKVISSRAPLHGALRSAFDKLYGYTSDADGIRHALMEESNLEQEDAIFMLAACSAFVSYLIAKQSRASTPRT